ncbi:hypothetical protein CLV59_106223 [Chitinophaga dinghuensis]|uniref:Lipoprotein n=1 Tax=Chitinophaga dinghuensis TaxID=1539050 RepID=A0A327VUL0_9BACT|nr:hypothetical protein [Chitinophaga dinghuensis]RAJ79162.1 hypothetical protein CLV59_106223 [Chitinophaga dinghuensis]
MYKRNLFLLLVLVMISCNWKENKKETEKSPKDISSFLQFVQSLPLVKIPFTYKNALQTIAVGHTFEDTATHYDRLMAARISTNSDVVAILFYGEQKDHGHYWVTSYHDDGTKLDQVQIGESINPYGQMGKYATKVVMENDSIIEFRKYYVEYTGNFFTNHTKYPSEIHLLAVQSNGKLVWKPVVKESFQTYLASFPKLTPPLKYDSTPARNDFKLAQRATSWFDFGALLQSDFASLYMVGKMEIPGKPAMVLLKVDHLDGGEDADSYGPTMMLVAYNQLGIETDRMDVTASYVMENYQTATSQFNMATNGDFTVTEYLRQGDATEGYSAIADERNLKCTLNEAGRFIRTYTSVKLTVHHFDPVKLHNSKGGTTEYDDVDYLGSLEDWNLAVFIHTDVNKTGKVISLLTVSPSGRVVSAMVLHNTTGNTNVKPLETMNPAYIRQEVKGALIGSATVSIAGKTYSIAQDGSIHAQ